MSDREGQSAPGPIPASGDPSAPNQTPALQGERLAELRVSARPDRLRLIRSVVMEAAAASGCSEPCVRDIVIAVDEACQNVIRHAYGGDPDGEILLDLRRDGERFIIYVMDFAEPVDTAKVKPRKLDDLKPGGLGTHFINECMDEAGFRSPPDGAGNCLWMVKKIQ